MGVDLLHGTLDTVFLEFKEGFPNFGVGDGCAVKELGLLLLTRQKLFKDVEQGLEINELWGVIHVKLRQVFQHLGFDIFNQRGVRPQLVKPGLELSTVPVAIDDHIQLNIWRGGQAQSALCEVGTTHQGVLAFTIVNVVKLAVQQVGLADGADFDLVGDPFGATTCDFLLLQAVG